MVYGAMRPLLGLKTDAVDPINPRKVRDEDLTPGAETRHPRGGGRGVPRIRGRAFLCDSWAADRPKEQSGRSLLWLVKWPFPNKGPREFICNDWVAMSRVDRGAKWVNAEQRRDGRGTRNIPFVSV